MFNFSFGSFGSTDFWNRMWSSQTNQYWLQFKKRKKEKKKKLYILVWEWFNRVPTVEQKTDGCRGNKHSGML